jgi:hypothetical protein
MAITAKSDNPMLNGIDNLLILLHQVSQLQVEPVAQGFVPDLAGLRAKHFMQTWLT